MSRYRTITVSADIEISAVLDDLSDDDIREECKRRGIEVFSPPKPDALKLTEHLLEAEYAFDTWEHDLRTAFLARDHRHFEVLLARAEERFRATLVRALAVEKVSV